VEQIIAKLVREFEDGKMNRRQLIRSLTVAASAAVGGTAACTSLEAAEPKGFQAVEVNHISYVVADYKKTRDFYADLLGMKVSKDDGKQCYLSFGNTFLLPRNARPDGKTPLINHVAYTIDNWDKDKVEADLKRRGLTPRPDTENSFHVKDPDGFDLQISGKDMKA
jgi:catechol 2,3-dioxygenase-like lactoylglutathione lyase family enzyme